MCGRVLFLLVVLQYSLVSAQNAGCRDPKAVNYESNVILNNGSCEYRATSSLPQKVNHLPNIVRETSGLIYHDGLIWTHNDSGGEPVLYGLDTASGDIKRTVRIRNSQNIDWEDIAIDEQYLYIADIGNNNGNRKDLAIYQVALDDMKWDTVNASVRNISFPDQVDFSTQANKTNYDAESLVSIGEQLYIFSKNWVDQRTRIYSLNKKDTSEPVRLLHEWNSNGMITGADFNTEDSVLALCGYTLTLQPFVWFIWDFSGKNIWEGNKRRINLSLPFHQIEGIASSKKGEYWLSNEEFTTLLQVKSALFKLNSNEWIDSTNNLLKITPTPFDNSNGTGFRMYPNPTNDILNIDWDEKLGVKTIEVFSADGRNSEMWWTDKYHPAYQINISHYNTGTYIMVLTGDAGKYYQRFVVQK